MSELYPLQQPATSLVGSNSSKAPNVAQTIIYISELPRNAKKKKGPACTFFCSTYQKVCAKTKSIETNPL